ncbi:MAG: tyrosine-type recombinase/integrase [Bacteroidota bacterium]|nr:tyrosine-type recombinase/integrase [Bacteroidota bacterium]
MTDSFIRYLEFERRYSKHTISSYTIDLQQFIDFYSANYNTAKIEDADYHSIRSWIISLMESGLEPRSVNRKIACLKSFYKFLLKQGKIQKNPTLRIKAPKVKKRLPVFVEELSMDTLLDQTEFKDNFEGTRDRLIIELLYGTGIRLSELIHIREVDINFYDQTLKVKGKGNKERIIPIHKNLEQIIKAYNIHKSNTLVNIQSEYLLVSDKGEDTYPVMIQRIVKKYIGMVSTVEKRSPHVMRHSFATHLLNKGADLNAIKELLGHSNLAATQVYTHNSLEKLKSIFKQAHPKA